MAPPPPAGQKSKKANQLIAAITATLGGFALGNVIGWSSPALEVLKDDLDLSDENVSWGASIMTLGAASTNIFVAVILDKIGRKWTMLIMAIPFVVAWFLLAFVNSFALLLVGRFITGFCGGTYCVAAPMYTAELSEKGIRGALGVLFQFMIVTGILLVYILGIAENVKVVTIPCAAIPVVLAIVMFFMPESPVYYLKRGKEEKARKSLQFFRGKDYNIDDEIKEMAVFTKVGDEKIGEVLKKKSTIKACVMLLGVHIIQQLSGINIVMFYAHRIFSMASGSLSSSVSAIIVGVVQLVATTASVFLVDKAGRKILFIISLSIMCASLVVLGVYFIVKEKDPDMAQKIAILPVLTTCLYMVGFSLGTGPLPWALMGELVPNRIKSVMNSFACCFNWLLAFAVTKSFTALVDAVGAAAVFWGYAVLCALGILFIIFVLIETKNKTLEEIQVALGASSSSDDSG